MSPVLEAVPANGTNGTFVDGDFVEDGRFDGRHNWWFSPTAQIVKWSVLLGITFLIFAFFLGGYLHARRRIRKGLYPLSYHRFMVSKHYHAPPPTAQNNFGFYRLEDNGYHPGQAQPTYNSDAPLPATHKREETAQAYEVAPEQESSSQLPPREPKKGGLMQGGFLQRFKKS